MNPSFFGERSGQAGICAIGTVIIYCSQNLESYFPGRNRYETEEQQIEDAEKIYL
jgi:hypothetical protein